VPLDLCSRTNATGSPRMPSLEDLWRGGTWCLWTGAQRVQIRRAGALQAGRRAGHSRGWAWDRCPHVPVARRKGWPERSRGKRNELRLRHSRRMCLGARVAGSVCSWASSSNGSALVQQTRSWTPPASTEHTTSASNRNCHPAITVHPPPPPSQLTPDAQWQSAQMPAGEVRRTYSSSRCALSSAPHTHTHTHTHAKGGLHAGSTGARTRDAGCGRRPARHPLLLHVCHASYPVPGAVDGAYGHQNLCFGRSAAGLRC